MSAVHRRVFSLSLSPVHLEEREKYLRSYSLRVRGLFCWHFSFLFLLRSDALLSLPSLHPLRMIPSQVTSLLLSLAFLHTLLSFFFSFLLFSFLLQLLSRPFFSVLNSIFLSVWGATHPYSTVELDRFSFSLSLFLR